MAHGKAFKSLYLDNDLLWRIEKLQEEQKRRSFNDAVVYLLSTHPLLPALAGSELRVRIKAQRGERVTGTVEAVTRSCPACGDRQVALFPNGKARCNVCLHSWSEAA